MLTLLLCVLFQAEPKVETTSLEDFVTGSVAAQKQELTDRVAALEQKLKRVRGPAAAATRKQLTAAKADLKKPPFPPKATMMRMDSPVGTAGELTTPFREGVRNVKSCAIIQVLNDKELLCRTESGAVFVLQVKSTVGKVDDAWFHLDGIYETGGTTKYTSVLGAGKTVFLIKHWKHEAEFEALTEADRDKYIKPAEAAPKPVSKKPAAKK